MDSESAIQTKDMLRREMAQLSNMKWYLRQCSSKIEGITEYSNFMAEGKAGMINTLRGLEEVSQVMAKEAKNKSDL